MNIKAVCWRILKPACQTHWRETDLAVLNIDPSIQNIIAYNVLIVNFSDGFFSKNGKY